MKFNKAEIYDYDFLVDVIEDRITGVSRWTINHEVVFQHANKFWLTNYRTGATEMQDERPFEYETEIECVEVIPVERVVKVYEPVEV